MSRLSGTFGRSRYGLHSGVKVIECKLRRNAEVPSVCVLEAVSHGWCSGRGKFELLDVVVSFTSWTAVKLRERDEYCDRAAVSMGTKESLVVEYERDLLLLWMCLPEISCRFPHTLSFSA